MERSSELAEMWREGKQTQEHIALSYDLKTLKTKDRKTAKTSKIFTLNLSFHILSQLFNRL